MIRHVILGKARTAVLLAICIILFDPAANGQFALPWPAHHPASSPTLVMRAKFLGETEYTHAEDQIDSAFSTLSSFLASSSYLNMDLDWTIVTIEIPFTKASYLSSERDLCPPFETKSTLHAGRAMKDGLQKAEDAGLTVADYEFHVLVSSLTSGNNGMPGGKSWVKSLNFGILAQEFIHSMNVAHSNGLTSRLDPAVISPWDPGAGAPAVLEEERADRFDVMSGATWGVLCHADVRVKNYLGWLPDSRVKDVTASGTYEILQQDLWPLPLTNLPVALRIHRNDAQDYWIEFRQLIHGFPPPAPDACVVESNADRGALVYLSDKEWRYLGLAPKQSEMAELLDMTPRSVYSGPITGLEQCEWIDGALEAGFGWFSDPASGIEIKVNGFTPASPGMLGTISIDVNVPKPGSGWNPQPNSMSVIDFVMPPTTVTTFDAKPDQSFIATVTDAEGIGEVWFEFYNTFFECPFITVQGTPIGNDTYETVVDTSAWETDGYVVVVNAIDTSPREESFGRFFMVNNN